MNPVIQVDILGNAASLQVATDEATASLDKLDVAAGGSAAKVDAAGVASATADPAIASTGATAETASYGFDTLRGSVMKAVLPLAALFLGFEGIKDIIKAGSADINLYNSAQAQIQNTLKNTNDAVGLTIDQLDKMAEANSKNNDITVASNLSAEQTLLNYGAIGSTVFPAAAAQVDNVATAMANIKGRAVASLQDMSQGSKLLGKALEDPATGMTAFTRVGIKFTAQQTDQVKALEKSGDLIGAQNLLLSDLTEVVGGKASTAMDTYQGKVAYGHKVMDEFSGSIVGAGQNALESLGRSFYSVLPSLIKLGDTLYNILLPAFHAVGDVVKNDLMPTIEAHKKGLEDVLKVYGGAMVVALITLVGILRDFIAVIAAVIAVVSWLINVISDVVHFFTNFHQSLNDMNKDISGWFNNLPHIILSAVNGIGNWLYQAGKDLLQGFVNGIENAAGSVFNAVSNIGNKAVSALKGVLKIFSPSQVFAELGGYVGAGFVQGIQGTQTAVANASGQLATSAINGVQNTNMPSSVIGNSLSGAAGSSANAPQITFNNATLQFTTADAVQEFLTLQGRNSELTSLGLTTVLRTA